MVSNLVELNTAAWLEDVEFLVDALLSKHPDPFTQISKEDFTRTVEDLRASIPTLPVYAILMGMKRLLAAIRDGHTNLPISRVPGFRRYPLRLYLYSDGLYVQAATRKWARAAGAQVVSIGDMSAEAAYERMRGLVAYDNEMGMKSVAPSLLTVSEVLAEGGIVTDMENARWDLLTPSGEQLTWRLAPMRAGQMGTVEWVDARDEAEESAPIYLKHMGDIDEYGEQEPNCPFWFEYLEDSATAYVQVNAVRDKEGETLAQFYDRLFSFIEGHAVERLVIDIRLNGGGNNLLNQPLVHHLIRCDKVNRPGRLFTIIGRKTFSAAMNLTNDLERHTRTLFVGEPTGSSPNHFGEGQYLTLPNSGVGFYVSRLRWQYSYPMDNRPWVAPDISAELYSSEYSANRDPALDAILRVEPGSATVAPFPDRIMGAIKAYGRSR